MNILHTEWSDGWGGQEIRILADAQALTARGHQVTILAPPQSGLAKNTREKGLPLIALKINNTFDIHSLWKLVRLFQKEQYQVVNTHSSVDSWVASLAARLARVPVLIRTRHLSVPVAAHPLNFVYKWPDAIVTTSDMITRRLVEVNGFNPQRVITIPTGVDLERFDPDLDPGDLKKELGLDPNGRVVTMVAVLRSWKRHEIFLEAASRVLKDHRDVNFLIVGEGPRRSKIESKIKELNLNGQVILTGYRTDIPQILAISDVCALTSESSEGVPQSVLQYQAMAKPVVGSTAGGIPEVIQDGRTGLLCPINDPEAVARAVSRLLDHPELGLELGRRARSLVVQQHSLEVMASLTVALYEKILENKRSRGKPFL